MKYITVKDAADMWKMSERMVRKYCEQDRIDGAIHAGNVWVIPAKAKRPSEMKGVEIPLTAFAKRVVYQRSKNNHYGIYEYIQVNLAYSSNRMASNRLTRNEVEEVYRTNKITTSFEPVKIDDLIETINHFSAVRYVIDTILTPLSRTYIKKLHEILTYGTYAERKEKLLSGEFRNIKAYKSKSKSLSSSQVLMKDYKYSEAEIIAKEMMDQLCLDMAAKKLATDSVSLYIGYSYTYGVPGVSGTAQLSSETNAASVILPAIGALYRRVVNPAYGIRRVCLSCNNVVPDHGNLQLNMFEDATKQLRNKALQEAMLEIRYKYGKNSILRGISYTPASTARERNNQIGGHKSGNEDSKSAHAKVKTG